jgi:hypothetical protein
MADRCWHLQTFSAGQARSALPLEADVVNGFAMSPKAKAGIIQSIQLPV